MSHMPSAGIARDLFKALDSAEGLISRTISATDARAELNKLLDAAEGGKTTLVVRHSKPSAAIIPAKELDTYTLVRRLLRELAETIEMSSDPAIVAAVKKAQSDIARGDIFWDDPDAEPGTADRRGRRKARARVTEQKPA